MNAAFFFLHKRSGIRAAIVLFLSGIFAAGTVMAQHPVGIFDDHMDIGNPKLAGDASFDEATQTYDIKGAGDNIWFNHDEYQFVYKKMKGDFILTGDFAFAGDTSGSIGHRKIGWMIRESTESERPAPMPVNISMALLSSSGGLTRGCSCATRKKKGSCLKKAAKPSNSKGSARRSP